MVLLAVCDVHEGINFGFRVDPETGISERSLDLHRNFVRAAQHAIANRMDLFIVGGDLFDRTHVSPAFRELVRKDVIEPLGEAGIETWLVAGNHDQPRLWSRGTSLDDFRGYPHVKVFREPAVERATVDGEDITFLIIPYLHPEHIADRVRERLGEEVPREQAFEMGRRMLKEWMRKRAEEAGDGRVLLLGHYYVEGAKVRSTDYPEVLPGEFSFTLDMIPSAVELAIFGHIHLHQAVGDRVVYVGAPERVDWGERKDPKGFLSYAPGDGWSFHPLPTRPMIKVDVDARGQNPTAAVLEALKEDIKDALVRVEIRMEEGQRELLDEGSMAERLSEAFHYEVGISYHDREKLSLAEFTLDPLTLFDEYVHLNYGDHPRLEEIMKEGEAILKEVLL
jgi:exonuclease SbcD